MDFEFADTAKDLIESPAMKQEYSDLQRDIIKVGAARKDSCRVFVALGISPPVLRPWRPLTASPRAPVAPLAATPFPVSRPRLSWRHDRLSVLASLLF